MSMLLPSIHRVRRSRLVTLLVAFAAALVAPAVARAQAVQFSKTTLLYGPSIVADTTGRLTAFAIGDDGAIYQRAQASAGGTWSAWTPMVNPNALCITVGQNTDGRLELFGVNVDGVLFHLRQPTVGGQWHAESGPMTTATCPLQIARNADGRLEVFDSNGHFWQTSPGSASWSGVDALGQDLTNLAVAQNADGRLEVFGQDSSCNLVHAWQTSPNGPFSGWSTLRVDTRCSAFAVGREADGRLAIILSSTTGAVQYIAQVAPNSGWAAPQSLGSNTIGPMQSLTTALNADGRLEAFAYDAATHHIDNIWETRPGGPFSGWNSLGGTPRSDMAPAVVLGANGHLSAVMMDASSANLLYSEQTGSGWTSWAAFGTNPSVTPPSSPRLTVTPGAGSASLSWIDLGVHYGVFRSTNPGQEVVIADAGASTSYQDFNLPAGTQQCYTIVAYAGVDSIRGAPSNEVCVTPTALPQPPVLNVAVGNGTAVLSWVNTGATSYWVFRSTNPGQESLLTSVTGSTGYTDTGLTNGIQECYVVASRSGSAVSAPSNEVCVTPSAGTTTGTMQITLQWDQLRYTYHTTYDPSSGWGIIGARAPAGATVTSVSFNDPWNDHGNTITEIDLWLNDTSGAFLTENVFRNNGSTSGFNGLSVQGTWSGLPHGTFVGSTPPDLPVSITWQH